MREREPSHTAQRVAVRRAVHQLIDEPRVFTDPLALAILGRESSDAEPLGMNVEPEEGCRHVVVRLPGPLSRF